MSEKHTYEYRLGLLHNSKGPWAPRILLSFLLISGCSLRQPFQPIPDLYLLWSKPGSNQLDAIKTLLECGSPSPAPWGKDLFGEKYVEVVSCMKQAGYFYNDPFEKSGKICEKYHQYPACQPGAEIPRPSVSLRLNSEYCRQRTNRDYCEKNTPNPEGCSYNNYKTTPPECLP
jgi:hypothetical protein